MTGRLIPGDIRKENPMTDNRRSLPDTLPLLPVTDSVIFPRMVVPLMVKEDEYSRLIDDTLGKEKFLVVGLVMDPKKAQKDPPEVHRVGTAATAHFGRWRVGFQPLQHSGQQALLAGKHPEKGDVHRHLPAILPQHEQPQPAAPRRIPGGGQLAQLFAQDGAKALGQQVGQGRAFHFFGGIPQGELGALIECLDAQIAIEAEDGFGKGPERGVPGRRIHPVALQRVAELAFGQANRDIATGGGAAQGSGDVLSW